MRVLWVTNVAPSAASRLLGESVNPFGGWLQGSLTAVGRMSDVEVVVASPGADTVRTLGTVEGTKYIGFPTIRRRAAAGRGREIAARVIAAAAPDLIHIHGTELPHSLPFALAADGLSVPAVVSIQGLVSVIAQHMTAFLPPSVVHGVGTRPWVRSDRVAGLRRSFELQGRLERETLGSVSHVIGRTTWDRVCTEEINPNRHYHHCEETLRPSFYSKVWRLDDARPHSVLVGQGHYPIKGLHLLLAAMPAVVSRFTDTVVTVAGDSPVAGRRTPYARHLARLIRDFGLGEHIRFVGPQTEAEMLAHYRRTYVVACPSVIENSPNTVAEGMLMGVPVVAAHVGGVPDLLTHGLQGLTYQSDAPYMLANSLVTLFENSECAVELGAQARLVAQRRHDPHTNARRTVQIYTDILDEEMTT